MTILNINHKQEELMDQLFQQVHERFPTITRQGIGVNPDDKEHLWVYIDAPLSDDEEVELMNYAGELTADILLGTGYWISLIPAPALQEA